MSSDHENTGREATLRLNVRDCERMNTVVDGVDEIVFVSILF